MNPREIVATLSAKSNPRVVAVEVPPHGTMYVRVMSGAERDAYESIVYRDTDPDTGEWVRPANLRALLLVRTVCDDKGVRAFTDDEVELVGDADSAVMGRLYRKAFKINGLGEDTEKSEGNG